MLLESYHLRFVIMVVCVGSLSGRLFLYDGLAFSTTVIKLRPRQPACVVCGDNPSVDRLIDYTEFCGTPAAHDKPITMLVRPITEYLISKRFADTWMSSSIAKGFRFCA